MIRTRCERIGWWRGRVGSRAGERRGRHRRRRLLEGLLRIRLLWIWLLRVLLSRVRLLLELLRLLRVGLLELLRLLRIGLLELLGHHLPRHRGATAARGEPDDEADHSDHDEDDTATSPVPTRVVGKRCDHAPDRTRSSAWWLVAVVDPWLGASDAPFNLAGSVGGSFECAHVMLSNRWFEATSFWKAEHVQARRHRGAQAPPI